MTTPVTSAPARILVVDDTPMNVKLLVDVLSARGYAVTAATDGEAALAQVAEATPDLVLLDIMMPLMNGYAVIARVRGQLGLTKLPIIIMSAKGETESKDLARDLGADDYLTKPFVPAVLKAKINALLEPLGA